MGVIVVGMLFDLSGFAVIALLFALLLVDFRVACVWLLVLCCWLCLLMWCCSFIVDIDYCVGFPCCCI